MKYQVGKTGFKLYIVGGLGVFFKGGKRGWERRAHSRDDKSASFAWGKWQDRSPSDQIQ